MVPMKRLLDNSNEPERKPLKILNKIHSDVERMVDSRCSNYKPQEIGRNRPSAVSRPPAGKVKFLDPACLKGGYDRKPKVTTTIEIRRKILGNVDMNVSKMTLNGYDKLINSKPDENGKLKSFKPDESGRNKACFASRSKDGEDKLTNSKLDENGKLKNFEPDESGRNETYFASRSKDGKDKLTNSMKLGTMRTYLAPRSTGKVKYYDPTCEDQKSEQKYEVTSDILSQNEQTRRENIKEAVSIFEQVQEQLLDENKSKPNDQKIVAFRVPYEVAKIVKQKLKWKDPEKTLGPVCGIQIGDQFKYRAQLEMFGLHCQPYSGIDFVNIGGKNLAISIVDAQRYSNESGSSDILTYSGHGGRNLFGFKLRPEDQKDQELVRGNMAMKNSMDKKTPVRVIKKVQGCGKEAFVYDGLYIVDHYGEETSAQGKIVFKFYLNRVPGQPSLETMLKW